MSGSIRCSCHNEIKSTSEVIKLVLCKDDLVTALLTGNRFNEKQLTLEEWYERTIRKLGMKR